MARFLKDLGFELSRQEKNIRFYTKVIEIQTIVSVDPFGMLKSIITLPANLSVCKRLNGKIIEYGISICDMRKKFAVGAVFSEKELTDRLKGFIDRVQQ